VFKNMVVHPQAVTEAHRMACAAGKQHKFTAFWDVWWRDAYPAYTASRDKTVFDSEHLAKYAKTAGLDVRRAQADMASCEAFVKQDMDELAAFHVNATPTFFFNGKEIAGAMPKEQFQTAIDDALKTQAASGVAAAKYYDQVVLAKGAKSFQAKNRLGY